MQIVPPLYRNYTAIHGVMHNWASIGLDLMMQGYSYKSHQIITPDYNLPPYHLSPVQTDVGG